VILSTILDTEHTHTDRQTYTGWAKKISKRVLSELRQIYTKFDSFWHTYGQDNRIIRGTLLFHLN